jgi:hypothetical protein
MEILEIMNERHSVRQYLDKEIEPEKQSELNELVSKINSENNLHIQIFYNEPKCFSASIAHYGSFKSVNNYIALVGKKSATLDETLGFYGEMLVLKAQELGLNTCWVALNHGKSAAVINKGEKLVCVVSLGYGANKGVPHKSKSVNDVSNYKTGMPDWFLNGVEAALLAPTAVNQQRFYFEYRSDGFVKASCSLGIYTKLDLGIAKYHFELIANKTVV